MAKLLTTAEQMRNTTRPEKRYYVSWYERGYTERNHNDRWEVPGKTHIKEVTASEYQRSNSKHSVDIVQVPVSFDEFTAFWKSSYEKRVLDFSQNQNLNTLKSAVFAVKQYGYIVDVKVGKLRFAQEEVKELLTEMLHNEREGINKLVEYLDIKKEKLLKEAEEEKRLKEERKKERAIKKAEREAKKAEKERLAKIAQMEKELEKLKNQ